MPLTPLEQAELDAIEVLQEGEPFVDFVQEVRPMYWPVPPHLQRLYDLFERMRYERIFATVSMPPRHGKTTSIGLGIGHRIKWDPACLNFYATYALTPAADRGSDFRKVTNDAGIPTIGTDGDYRTHFGGGLKTTSDGGQITGYGANGGLITVDDLLRGWEEANSEGMREKKWNWLMSDAFTRAEGGSSILIVHTRWHEDDPIGRILKATDKKTGLSLGRKWEHINLPAVHDGNYNPIDERVHPELAQPLWTSVDAMNPNNVKAAMEWYAMARATGERAWWALYQGVPRSDGTKIFEADPKFFFVDQMEFLKGGFRGCIVMDPAATAKQTADYTAIGVGYMTGYGRHSRLFVRRAAKRQQTVPASARWASMWQKRWRLQLVVESIGAFSAIPQSLKETEPGMSIVEFKPGVKGWLGGDKVTRSGPASGAWNDGRILVCNELDSSGKLLEDKDDRGWQSDFISVVQSFTGVGDKEDDYVDVISHMWNILYREEPQERQGSYRLGGSLV